MATIHRSGVIKKTKDSARFIITTIIGFALGFFIGSSFPFFSHYKVYLPSSHRSSIDVATASNDQGLFVVKSPQTNVVDVPIGPKKYIRRNPRGSKLLPPRINVPESDLHLRRLYGLPPLDLKRKPKYLAAFSVGIHQMYNIDACVKKFSEDFQIVLFHYDGKTTEWDQFEWSKKAIHVTASKQTKWWYAKRFLHPDVVAAYEYIFIWDEDLGVEHFNADRYIELVKKHGLEISQPGLGPNDVVTWEMTRRREDQEVHKVSLERPGWCSDQHLPPCAAFVEIMAPVFSREAWRCVWYMIQNDLVHGWGLDFALRRCVEPAHEKIGVVDSEWIIHKVIPSLVNQGVTKFEKSRRQEVRIRCKSELSIFQDRLANADMAYHAQFGNG
ncbi:hypothetical protein ERO13_A13G230966v2 [Gossypium hirsutum]|uniref:Uncharacterized protein n=1 Tax=Gossypium hirsutum TaxID=3635 RepID=A0ABM2ZH01_GOSHI|nr:uncharacterized protein LOC107948839 [Gossypium hirsutum]XP_040941907.1 uncharacterized protein LOC107948839 [Gossypium hirsutum]KAG4167991.1 hypothetical protein ERO13_A13G230966v2 [Gossypium hirsutum]